MAKHTISADIRDMNEKVSYIRQSKRVPGIVYGRHQEPISITMDSSDFLRLYRKAGESNIINVSVGKKKLDVLVHMTQKHPVTWDFTHVDFYAITQGEALNTHIHFNFIGDAPAIKEGAIIEEHMKGVDVKCLPSDLVDHFDVDLSVLKEEGDAIRISDLGIDTTKYELSVHDEDVVANASLPRAAVEEEDDEDEVVTGSDEDIAANEADEDEGSKD